MRTLLFAVLSVALVTSCCDHDTDDRCSLEPEVGPCDAAFQKYYFDKEEQRCKEFTWGGCGGVVPFHTLEECKVCAGE